MPKLKTILFQNLLLKKYTFTLHEILHKPRKYYDKIMVKVLEFYFNSII